MIELGVLSAIFGNLPWYVLGACVVFLLIAAGVVWAFVRWAMRED